MAPHIKHPLLNLILSKIFAKKRNVFFFCQNFTMKLRWAWGILALAWFNLWHSMTPPTKRVCMWVPSARLTIGGRGFYLNNGIYKKICSGLSRWSLFGEYITWNSLDLSWEISRNETKDMLGSKDSMSLFNGNFGIPLGWYPSSCSPNISPILPYTMH